jgi:cell division septum initiation protein DivIVA
MDENAQTDRLFFILIYKKKELKPFLDALQSDYSWLCEKIKNCNERNDQLILKYESAIKHSDIPKNRDMNIHRCKYVSIAIFAI